MRSEKVESKSPPSVGLFVTCLVDLLRPSIGFAAIKLLEDAGARVEVPETQTCCGQPAYNSGDREDAKDIARAVVTIFEPYDYVVAPSGSCAGMLRRHYPELLASDPDYAARALALASKTFELASFLTEVLDVSSVNASRVAKCTYHDSCSALRELGVRDAPRLLLRMVGGLELVEMDETEVCCGFGGLFSVKYPDIANAMVEAKARNVEETGAHCLLSGDLGCLLHIAGKLSRDGSRVECRHFAELIAGMTDAPPIGYAKR
jgi:L-lactate dehydrogenase complex protein LldE